MVAPVTVMNNTTSIPVTPTTTNLSFDNLYAAILQCFAIIMAGYIAGRASLITQPQGRGVGVFVGKFCLPALLFRSMVTLDFSMVNWYFLLGIAVSKTAVFICVAVLTLLVKRPLNLGCAGLFSIFATQSNDFALGYPILKALYSESNPEYLQYIYLVAPISLVFLNPIGFTMMELHRRSQEPNQRSRLAVALHVTKDVLSNPIVFMVLVGIGGNFLFQQKIPEVLDDILEVLGNAYSASALFYLGLSLVGKVQGSLGLALIVPLLLIAAKTLLLPLITWQVVGVLEENHLNDSRSLSMYGFLYGTFPTAPSVFLYSSQFGIAQEVIATGMVVCTFLSAPLMFASAKMMTVVVDNEMDYKSLLMGTSFDFSIISLICNAWLLGLMFFSKKYKKMPHHFLVCLIVCQSVACIGMISYDGVDTKVVWQHYVQFVLLLVGVFSTRCFAATISVVLYLLHCRSLCFVLRNKIWLYFFGLGFPILGTGMLLIFGSHHMHNEIDPSFHYGEDQALLSVVILAVCSAINITFLVLRQRNARMTSKDKGVKVKRRRPTQYDAADQSAEEEGTLEEDESLRERLLPEEPVVTVPKRIRAGSNSKLLNKAGESKRKYRSTSCSGCTEDCSASQVKQTPVRHNSTNIEDIVPFPVTMQGSVNQGRTESSAGSTSSEDLFSDTLKEGTCESGTCSYSQKRKCAGLLRCYHATNNPQVPVVEDEEEVRVRQPRPKLQDEYQTERFIILLLVLQISMFMGLFLCSWRLFNQDMSGIYVEIEFLDSFFNYAQSLVVFAIFGFDTRLVILPCIRRWRKCIYGVESVYIPDKSQLAEEDVQLCEQFLKYHKANCEEDIVRNMNYRFRSYSNVFCGSSLCDWLLEVGLCHDRSEAVVYGRTLLRGQVIVHVTSEHNFHDMPYFYRFTQTEEDE